MDRLPESKPFSTAVVEVDIVDGDIIGRADEVGETLEVLVAVFPEKNYDDGDDDDNNNNNNNNVAKT